jgi:hypothetical protein
MKARLVSSSALLLVVAGCATMAKNDPNIPRVTRELVAASGSGTTPILLQRGRETYVGACAACHAPVPVGKYTMIRWREIVADMADRTELPAEPRAALLAYLTAVTASPRPN